LGAAVVNGSIYFIGTKINEQYDPHTNTWTSKTPSPIAFDYNSAAVTSCQNKIYAIGGTVNMVYDPATDTWENKTAMPTVRYTNDANVVDEKIYVISGQIPAALGVIWASNATEVYDPENDSWSELAPIPKPVVGYASAVLDNKIYIIGGRDGDPDRLALNLVQIYDLETNQWTQGIPLEEPVAGAAATATTGLMAPKRIYVIGGNIINAGHYVRFSDHTQIYDPQTQSWSFGAQMPTGRTDLALVNVNDTLYALGGTNKTVSVMVPGGASQQEWDAAWDKIASMRTHANERYLPLGYGTMPPPASSPSPSETQNPAAPLTPSPSNPELPSWIPMLLFVLGLLVVALAVYKRRMFKTPIHYN